jgi:hypothetical protein
VVLTYHSDYPVLSDWGDRVSTGRRIGKRQPFATLSAQP